MDYKVFMLVKVAVHFGYAQCYQAGVMIKQVSLSF